LLDSLLQEIISVVRAENGIDGMYEEMFWVFKQIQTAA